MLVTKLPPSETKTRTLQTIHPFLAIFDIKMYSEFK